LIKKDSNKFFKVFKKYFKDNKLNKIKSIGIILIYKFPKRKEKYIFRSLISLNLIYWFNIYLNEE